MRAGLTGAGGASCSAYRHEPALLKLTGDTTAQIIIHGRARTDMNARNYGRYKAIAMRAVLESHRRLAERYDDIIV
jgi:adenosylcobyric acid synthase